MKLRIALVLVVLLAGCGTTQSWNLSVTGYVDDTASDRRFIGEVELSGKSTGVSVHNVTVHFVGVDGRTVDELHLAELNNSNTLVKINRSIPQPIQAVLITVEFIEGARGTECSVMGLEKHDGSLIPKPQREIVESPRTPSNQCFER